MWERLLILTKTDNKSSLTDKAAPEIVSDEHHTNRMTVFQLSSGINSHWWNFFCTKSGVASLSFCIELKIRSWKFIFSQFLWHLLPTKILDLTEHLFSTIRKPKFFYDLFHKMKIKGDRKWCERDREKQRIIAWTVI